MKRTQIERPTATSLLKGDFGRVMHLTFAPQQQMSAHKHPGQQVAVHVLQGSIEQQHKGKPLTLAQGSFVYASGEDDIGFHNTAEEVCHLLIMLLDISLPPDSQPSFNKAIIYN